MCYSLFPLLPRFLSLPPSSLLPPPLLVFPLPPPSSSSLSPSLLPPPSPPPPLSPPSSLPRASFDRSVPVGGQAAASEQMQPVYETKALVAEQDKKLEIIMLQLKVHCMIVILGVCRACLGRASKRCIDLLVWWEAAPCWRCACLASLGVSVLLLSCWEAAPCLRCVCLASGVSVLLLSCWAVLLESNCTCRVALLSV